ncbi:MAG: ribosomal protein S18-alanine N-acetyltransferase [Clostridia bacterium]|nr:ribosomal protein S18-alanine N-acetyltransferase [Clostridia bacterium]
MIYRKWQDADNEKIAFLEKICFSDPWSYDSVRETHSLDNFYGVVAEDCGEVIGYAGAIFAYDSADIALVAVQPEYRRNKIGEKLVNELIGALLLKKITQIFLEVRVSNESAKALYLKLGFKPVGIRKNYYENSEDAIVMLKVLCID